MFLVFQVKGDTIFNTEYGMNVASKPLRFENTVIYYVDEKAPEFTMKRLTPGVIAVIVVVVLAIVAGILVLVRFSYLEDLNSDVQIKSILE